MGEIPPGLDLCRMKSCGLLYCETLAREITEILSTEEFPHLICRSFTRHCVHSGGGQNPLLEPLDELIPLCDEITIMGCGCMSAVSHAEVPERIKIFIPDLFRDILLPETYLDEERKRGAYCMVPDNFVHHTGYFSRQGFHDTTIRTFFSDSVQSVILADTGWNVGEELIQEFSHHYQVPVTVIPVGTRPVRQYLKTWYLDWLLRKEREEHIQSLTSANKKTADYAMMVDLLGEITLATDENQVIRIISDLFALLFSPQEISFLPIVDGNPGSYVSLSGHPCTIPDEISGFLNGQEDYAIIKSGEGFFLRLRHENDTVGILHAAGFALPEYLLNYLDLGVFIANVCGLAITNSRIYQRLGNTIDALSTEITERERIGQALRESEEQYRSLFENMLEGFAYCQMLYEDDVPVDWIYLDVNDAFARLTGISGVQGRRATEVFPGIRENSPELFDIYNRVTASGIPETFETFFTNLNIWLNISVYQPKPGYFVAVFDDISKRKEAEEKLKKIIRDNETILANVPSMIMFKDTLNRYIKINPAAASMIGRPIHEIEGRTYHDLYPQRSDDFLDHDRAVIESKKPSLGVLETIITPRGEQRWVQTDTVPLLDDSSEVIGLLVVSTDVTDSKRAKDAVSHANHKLNLLSGITRHDIANEIQILFGYLELAEDQGIPPDLKEYFDIINESVHHIERQIAFTRDYQDIGIKSPVWQNAGDVISHALHSINVSPIQVQIEISDVEIYADPLIVKVFFNLIDNARRYGEKITWIRFSGGIRGKDYGIICEDDGAGVPEEYKSKIFNREYFQHTGFGLNLSREILDITGITISETGVFGTGARFEMVVPEGNWRYIRKNQK